MSIFQAWTLNNRSIGMRLHLTTVTAVAAIACLLAASYVVETDRMRAAKIGELQDVVQAASAIAAAYQREESAGRMSRAEAQRIALAAIRAIRYHAQDYVFVHDQHRMLMHPIKPELEGVDIARITDPTGKRPFVIMAEIAQASGSGLVDYLWPRPGSAAPIAKVSFAKWFAPWGWVIATGVYVDDLVAARHYLAMILAGIGVVVTLLVGLVTWLLGRSVAHPTRNLTAATERLSRGELSTAVPGTNRGDELGALARALLVLKESALERVRLERASADQRGARDRLQLAMEQHTRDFAEVISGVLTGLTGSAAEMRVAAETLTEGTRRTRESAQRTAEGSNNAARELAAVAGTVAGLSSTAAEISRQVAQASAATQEAVKQSSETDAIFVRLAGMTERIEADVRMIASIAS
jgi:methyl-accepting chemotaxis protein